MFSLGAAGPSLLKGPYKHQGVCVCLCDCLCVFQYKNSGEEKIVKMESCLSSGWLGLGLESERQEEEEPSVTSR